MFGNSIEQWAKLIEQVDSNEDGKIDLKEFKNMMLAFVNEQGDS
jgi:Ca2+-binding EF-hand superfamily protein